MARKSTTWPRITVAYASVWSVPQIIVGTYALPSRVLWYQRTTSS
ncbi:hypothetical protein [Streptomyces actuosus]|nr:hypothetical protein [Streptomyces actuosus]